MKLYAYIHQPVLECVLKEGYLSVSMQENPPVLCVYRNWAKSEKREDIINYLESTFEGRSRSISCLPEFAPDDDYEHPYLDNLVKSSKVISFDLNNMIKDGVVEAIYCKDCSQTVKEDMEFENIYKVDNFEIDFTPLDWHSCAVKYGSPFNMLRHYMLVLKDGMVPPKYIKQEK